LIVHRCVYVAELQLSKGFFCTRFSASIRMQEVVHVVIIFDELNSQ
jgi:hypothetical protein